MSGRRAYPHRIPADTIGQGGPYANLQNMGTRNRIDTLTLAEGCQTFTIYDAMGDGIHNTQGDGHIDFSYFSRMKEQWLCRSIAITDTLKLIPCGKTARYSCKDMPLLSIYSAVSRLNKAAGREEYRVSRVIDGGAGCEITRK